MESEHAHLDKGFGVAMESRVHTFEKQQDLALHATRNIPGANTVIKDYFAKDTWKMPYSLPEKRPINLPLHLGF